MLDTGLVVGVGSQRSEVGSQKSVVCPLSSVGYWLILGDRCLKRSVKVSKCQSVKLDNFKGN